MARIIVLMFCTSVLEGLNQQYQQEYLTQRWTENLETTPRVVAVNESTISQDASKANCQMINYILILCLLVLSFGYVFCFCLSTQMEEERDRDTRHMKPH